MAVVNAPIVLNCSGAAEAGRMNDRKAPGRSVVSRDGSRTADVGQQYVTPPIDDHVVNAECAVHESRPVDRRKAVGDSRRERHEL